MTICLPTLQRSKDASQTQSRREYAPDVALADEHARVVDRLGEAELQASVSERGAVADGTFTLKTCVCSLRSKKSSILSANT